ncbi:MAG TPA: AMP-binding protein [Kofleriaceae bacterium]|nr:AMP-binding protein [Kofleriaceae bacterium]
MMHIELNHLQAHLRRHRTRTVTMSLGGRASSRSFEELAREVDRAAARLTSAGLRAGMRVGILAESSWGWIVHDLAIAACGAISVAFPAELAEHDPDHLLDQEELALLVISARLLGERAGGPAILVLDRDPTADHAARAVLPGRYPHEGDDHSCVYSSGTTNHRKGMIVTRSGTIELMDAFAEAYECSAGDRVLIFLPFWGYQQRLLYYVAAVHGMDIHVTEPNYLFQALRSFAPTLLIGPPALYASVASLAQRMPGGDPRQLLGGRPRVLITGMAKIKRDTLHYFRDRDLPLYEVYGLTECGVVTINRPGAERLGSVGLPLRGARVTIASDGEIVVEKRRPLARGYFAKPAVPDDTRIEGSQLFTGDLGHVDEDGFLHVRGRKSATIISSSGEKVQSEPLEEQLEGCSAIQRAVVFGGGALPYLVAVFEAAAGHGPRDAGVVREFLAALNPRLPEWARIHKWVISDVEFTRDNGLLTPTMKLNRGRIRRRFAHQLGLPEDELSRSVASPDLGAPGETCDAVTNVSAEAQ